MIRTPTKHHETCHAGETDEWYTPPKIQKSLGHFDLDPASPVVRLFETADKYFTIEDNGLNQIWSGRVWLNPPYGPQTGKWLNKLANHGNGIAMIFARTETKMFFQSVWNRADGVFFFKGRISFVDATGNLVDRGTSPSVLVAYGRSNVEAIESSGLDGKLIKLVPVPREPDLFG